MANKTWYVHGPPGCGKNLHGAAIAAALGLTTVVEWEPGQRLPPVIGHLVLLHSPPPGQLEGFRRVMSFDDAMKLVRAKQRGHQCASPKGST